MNKFESPHQDKHLQGNEFSFDKWKLLTLSKTKGKIDTILDAEKKNIAKKEDPQKALERAFVSLDEKGAFHDINDPKNADELIARVTLKERIVATEDDIAARFGKNNFSSFSEELLG